MWPPPPRSARLTAGCRTLPLRRTQAHPGREIRVSDEAVGAGLPRQDASASAEVLGSGTAEVMASSFVSLVDQGRTGQPFAVVRSRGVLTCDSSTGQVQRDGLNDLAFHVRQGDRLREVDPTGSGTRYAVDDVTPGDRDNDGVHRTTTLTINRVLWSADVAQYPAFAKYADRPFSGGDGFELVIDQVDPNQPRTTYRVLVDAQAASC